MKKKKIKTVKQELQFPKQLNREDLFPCPIWYGDEPGFVNELMNPYFEELMVSEYIWLTDSSANIFPVNLKESSFAKKTSLNDRLINYTMSFEKSFSLVNNIR